MSFEVVARAGSKSDAELLAARRLTGLSLGNRHSLAMVGILSMFNSRPIIVGLLTLGYATLGALFVLAGLIVGTGALLPPSLS